MAVAAGFDLDVGSCCGQIELLFTFIATTLFFRETVDRREVTGILLVVAGIVLLVLVT